MALMPKRILHRKQQKGKIKGNAQRGHTVEFGEMGLQSLDPGWISAKQIEAGRVALVRAAPTAKIYTRIGDEFNFDWLRMHALKLPIESHWQEMAIRAVVEDLVASQSERCGQVLSGRKRSIEGWVSAHPAKVEHARIVMDDMRLSGEIDLAMVMVANSELKNMIAE